MKTSLVLLGLLLVAALMLAACGVAGAEPEVPAAAPAAAAGEAIANAEDGSTATTEAAPMPEDDKMAGSDDAAMAEEIPAGKTDETIMAGDNTMAKEPEAAMSEIDDPQGNTAMAGEVAMAEDAAMALPAWLTAELVDVTTGQPFAIAGQQGRVVLVETLAVWCSNCLRQQKEIQALHAALGERADLVSVGLDIDLNESPEQLRAHAERHGFDWTYAVATPEVAREIGQLYGNLFLNPPSTPMLVVDRQGQVHPLPFGIKSAADLQEALAPFLGGS